MLASRIAVHGKISSVKVARNRWQNKTADTMLELGAAAPLPVIPEKDATTPGCRRATLTAAGKLLDNVVMRDGLTDRRSESYVGEIEQVNESGSKVTFLNGLTRESTSAEYLGFQERIWKVRNPHFGF